MKKLIAVIIDRRTLDLFLGFLIREIPNVVQIMGIPSLFIILIKGNKIVADVLAFSVALILALYLRQKAEFYLEKNVRNPNSGLKVSSFMKTTMKQRFLCYLIVTAGAIALLVSMLIELARQ